VNSRGNTVLQPRDNVLLEYGLFSGVFGLEQSILCVVGKPKIPFDALGITSIDASNRYSAKPRLKEWLDLIQEEPLHPEVIRVGLFQSSDHERFTERI